jgi:2-methylaconitate cis-trans-isomerase PrpF
MGSTTCILSDPAGRDVRCSVLQALNTFLFIDSRDVGVDDPLSAEAESDATMDRVAHLSREVATRLWGDPSRALKVSLVAGRTDGGPGLRVRTLYPLEGRSHPSIAVTGASALALAAVCEGTVVFDRAGLDTPGLRITHPSGELEVPLKLGVDGVPTEVGIDRTCRLILRGTLY